MSTLGMTKENKARLEKIGQTLKVTSNELNDGFLELEKKLSATDLGITAWADSLLGTKHKQYKFGFCKLRNEWKLVCREVRDDEEGRFGLLTPISFMPRHIRVQAGEVVNQLIKNILTKAESYSKEMLHSTQTVEKASNKL